MKTNKIIRIVVGIMCCGAAWKIMVSNYGDMALVGSSALLMIGFGLCFYKDKNRKN